MNGKLPVSRSTSGILQRGIPLSNLQLTRRDWDNSLFSNQLLSLTHTSLLRKLLRPLRDQSWLYLPGINKPLITTKSYTPSSVAGWKRIPRSTGSLWATPWTSPISRGTLRTPSGIVLRRTASTQAICYSETTFSHPQTLNGRSSWVTTMSEFVIVSSNSSQTSTVCGEPMYQEKGLSRPPYVSLTFSDSMPLALSSFSPTVVMITRKYKCLNTLRLVTVGSPKREVELRPLPPLSNWGSASSWGTHTVNPLYTRRHMTLTETLQHSQPQKQDASVKSKTDLDTQ